MTGLVPIYDLQERFAKKKEDRSARIGQEISQQTNKQVNKSMD